MTKDIKSEIDDFFLKANKEKEVQEARIKAEQEESARKKQLAEDRFAEAVEKKILPAFEEFARHLEGHPITGEVHLDLKPGTGMPRHLRPGIYFNFMKSGRNVASVAYRHSATHPEMMEVIIQISGNSPTPSPVRVDTISGEAVQKVLMARLQNLKV